MPEGDGTVKKSNEELAQMHVEIAKQKLADGINDLEVCVDRLGFVFELMPDWNSDVMYDIKEACATLGFAMANLVNWDKEEN